MIPSSQRGRKIFGAIGLSFGVSPSALRTFFQLGETLSGQHRYLPVREAFKCCRSHFLNAPVTGLAGASRNRQTDRICIPYPRTGRQG